jgi:hypothetical protein
VQVSRFRYSKKKKKKKSCIKKKKKKKITANRVLVFIVVLGCWTSAVSAALTADFYDGTCPGAIEEINKVVVKAVEHEPRMAASLVRLHFHDYFVMVLSLELPFFFF